jgi:molybdenum cofactor guanylyltransferase
MRVLGCIIAGGKSSRMGQDKALMPWRGQRLIDHVAGRLRGQVDYFVINANKDQASFGDEVISDRLETGTPLAGLHAALSHAREQGFDAVLSVPCDTPLLPLDLAARLAGAGAAIACSGGQDHYLTGFWPVETLPLLQGLRRVQDFAAVAQARRVEWPVADFDPFMNINNPEDFAALDHLPLRD